MSAVGEESRATTSSAGGRGGMLEIADADMVEDICEGVEVVKED